jgi:uncharacterized membrane protein YdjX (TVP38/TMEM64 family)
MASSARIPTDGPGDPGDLWRRAGSLLRRLGPTGPLAIVAATLPTLGAVSLAFTFNLLGPWLRSLGGLGVAVYVAGFVLSAGLAILPTHLQAALGGWAFGLVVGLPSAVGGVIGAATVGYVIGQRATGDRVLRLIAEKPTWRAVYEALLGGSFWRCLLIVVLIRAALTPFALTNLVLAATRVHPVAYIVGTLVGITPRTAAAVFFAVGLQQVTAAHPQQRWVWLAGLAATVAAVLVIGHLASRAVARVTGRP